MIEQPAGVEQPTSSWPKKSLSSTSSATLHAAQQNAAAARQARTAVAGSQLHGETRELFRGLLFTLDAVPSEAAAAVAGGGGSAGAAADGSYGVSSGSHALHGACESVIATRHWGSAVSSTALAGTCTSSPSSMHASSTAPAAGHGAGKVGVFPAACFADQVQAAEQRHVEKMAAHTQVPAAARSGARRGGGRLKTSTSTSALPPSSLPPSGENGLSSSASVNALQRPGRRAPAAGQPRGEPPRPTTFQGTFSAPLRWAKPASHHPRAPTLPEPLLEVWREASSTGTMPYERLASAAATLQSHKMKTIDAAAVSKQQKLGKTLPLGGASVYDLKMVGDRVPSSSERLGLILQDIMH
jgi:hypothetical protein